MNKSAFCMPHEFFDPPDLVFYGWIDENRTFTGFAGVEMVDVQRTILLNNLNTKVQVILPSMPFFVTYFMPSFMSYSQDTDEHLLQEQPVVPIVPEGNLPIELFVDFASLQETGKSVHVLEFQMQALDENESVICQLPSANLTYIIETNPPELNHLGQLLAVGWFLLAFLWTACLASLLWIYVHRRVRSVQVMQPLFLAAITLGVAILAASIFSISITDENASARAANHACVATPWFVVIGFTVIFSALFSKLWRINKLFHGAHQCRRLSVKERDVIGPFLLWFTSNAVVLALRTALAPPTFERIEIDDNPANTIAVCNSKGTTSMVLYLGNVLITLSTFFAAAYQAYRARNISDGYAESKSLLMAIFIWMEILAIVVPVIFLVGFDSPTTSYFVAIAMIFGLCFSMLAAIFVPLWRQVHKSSSGSGSSGAGSSGGSLPSRGTAVHVTGLQPNHHYKNDRSATVATAVSPKPKDTSECSSGETLALTQHVASLETKVARLQQRNLELEALLSEAGENLAEQKAGDNVSQPV